MLKTSAEIEILQGKIAQSNRVFDKLKTELGRVVVGQNKMINRLLTGLLSNGHILLEGVPGLAKTLAIKSLAQAIDAKFNRIQFTPDLLPADVIGTLIYNPKTSGFEIRKGPVFANFVLADEINRAPAKVQSALLEAMQEKQVTIGDTTYRLDNPFLVLATQNPLDQEGTYPLPEAQADRFIMKVIIDYPSMEEEQLILRQNVTNSQNASINKTITIDELMHAKELTGMVYMDEKIEQYILNIVFATRKPSQFGMESLQPYISYGGSPRASINLALAAKAQAFLSNRGFVIPDDVKSICKDVLRHRIGLTYDAQAENVDVEQVIGEILSKTQTP